MTLTRYQQREQRKAERIRGWIISILYESRPQPVDIAQLSTDLDSVNFGAGRRTLANHVDFLRTLQLVRVFPLGAQSELTEPEQAKLIQRYCEVEDDRELNFTLCIRLSEKGIYFQEGLNVPVQGVEHMG